MIAPCGDRVAAIIPVFEEAGAIGPTVLGVQPFVDFVIVVDGGSRDGTAEEARAAGAQVIVETARGYGRACQAGAAAAWAEGAAIALYLDGDGADAVEQAPALLAPLRNGSADFVIGSRTRGTRAPGSMGWHQIVAGRLIGGLVGMATGTHYSDMSAFRAIRLDTLARLGMRELTYGWNLEMQMRAARLGLRIVELPVAYRCRIAGRSKVSGNLIGTMRASTRLLRTLIMLTLNMRRQSRREAA